MGMSAIRVSDESSLEFAIEELKKQNLIAAKRHIHFMKGFKNRWDGNFSEAEKEFREALIYQENDLHVLRELANTLVEMENYSEAEKFARSAFKELWGIEKKSARYRNLVSYATLPLDFIPYIGTFAQKAAEELTGSLLEGTFTVYPKFSK